MPSVRRRGGGVVAAIGVGLALMLSACTSTQTTAARLQLNDARLRAESVAVRVKPGQTSASVAVASVALFPGSGNLTVAVTVKNTGAEPVSDLPISVGYVRRGHTVYLNGAAGSAYFDDHLPAIAAHTSLTWVDAAAGTLPTGAHPFARVGAHPSVAAGDVTAPQIVARVQDGGSNVNNLGGRLAVQLTNRSSIPQYQLPVYVVLAAGAHVVAGGVGSVSDLAGGGHAKVLVDIPDFPTSTSGVSDRVRVEAPATIFK